MSVAEWEVLDWRRRIEAIYADVRASRHPKDGHALWVRERNRLLMNHPASPVPKHLRESFPGAVVAGYDPEFRWVVPVDPDVEPIVRESLTGTDGLVPLRRIGRVVLPVGTLDLWWVAGYGGGLLLPLKDATSGSRSYGGGRYVLDTVKGAYLGGHINELVVDLNFAYQPSCAYDEAWACPLPGPENTLPAAVPVGEQYVAAE